MDIEELLRKTVESKASDLHLTVGAPPMTRLHGEMTRLPYPELTRDTLRAMLLTLLTGEQQNRYEETHDLDFSIEIPGLARFRANFFVGRRGEGAVFRVIPTQIKTAQELGLPPDPHPARPRGARPGPGDRADRLRQVHDPGRHGGPDQHRAPGPHPHH